MDRSRINYGSNSCLGLSLVGNPLTILQTVQSIGRPEIGGVTGKLSELTGVVLGRMDEGGGTLQSH